MTTPAVLNPEVASAFASHTPDGHAYRMFFICGHMRSGTTWVKNLMNLHPDVNCLSEGPFKLIAAAVDEAKRQTWLTSSRNDMPVVLEGLLQNMARDYTLALARRKPDASWIGDHTSRSLRPVVPDAPHLHILRDGRDVLVSWTYHQLRIGFIIGEPFKSAMSDLTAMFARDPKAFFDRPELLLSNETWVRAAARGWAEQVKHDLDAVTRMERGEITGRVFPIRYEILVAETDPWRKRMYEFVGLDPALAAPLSEKSVTKASFWQENPTWFYRAGRVGDWKRYSTDPFKRWFKEEAGEALILAGYEKDVEW